ncbi:DUF1840 domain-containing protein [Thioalbus denitrificans]|uniref:Uncharacterized protein DUF1840 n=1 Tax=Thioalbus denitrificans TaxID=547122 RepID=A0A369CIX3_9GAMM|nr:DUF1840 domain-containing protein [Thioalbus denitrificans]RCX33035.1 uncharacterized protein DUF1840 [Thioalbus denitrificans]
MLITFQSRAYPNITMFGNVALQLIRLMGHSGSVPGAILAEDVPEALLRLRTAIAAGGAAPAMPGRDRDQAPDDEVVSLAHRALPLIELLEASAKAECNVMWDKN